MENIEENYPVDTEKEEEKGTIDYALDFVNHRNNNTFDNYRVKGLGLQLTLLGVAETQAERLAKMTEHIQSLDEQVFTEETFSNLKPHELVSLYKFVNGNILETTEYIKSVLSGLNWSKLETDLINVSTQDYAEDVDEDVAAVAGEILKHITEIKTKELIEEGEQNAK